VFYFDKPYFVVPADDLAEEAYIVLREALRSAKKVAIGQLSVRGREQLVSLKPCGRGIVMEVLRYADEVRKAQSYFQEIADSKPDTELLDLATTLIDKKVAPFKPDQFHDRYVDALRDLIDKKSKAKAKGETVIEDPDEAPAARGSNVIDLMAALRKSVGGGAKAADEAAKPEKPAAKKAAAKKPAAKKAPAKPDVTKADDAPAPSRSRKRA
jgi:DNA end-binding protein Ku